MFEWIPENLPEDIDAERSFLATCCAPGAQQMALECSLMVEPDDFVHPVHKAVFQALLTLLEEQEEVNSLTLKNRLEAMNKLNMVGGYPGLVKLLASEDVGRPHTLAGIVHEKAKQRRLVLLGTEFVRQANGGMLTTQELVNEFSSKLASLALNRQKQNLVEIHEFSQEWLAKSLEQARGLRAHGLKVGFPRMDGLTMGFKPGQLIVLAARPGIGKSALSANWALNVGRKGGRVALFSLEMDKDEILDRLVSALAQINMREALATYDPEKFEAIGQAIRDLEDMHIFIGDDAAIDSRGIRVQAERLVARNGKLDLIIVDYLQLASSSGKEKANESLRLGEITRGLKVLAKDLGVPVVLLSQLNREVEKRQGGRPQLSDLRDSGAIEQDADIVVFIHRNMKPTPEGAEEDRTAELILAKHRGGPTGIISLYFNAEQVRYVESTRETATVPVGPSLPKYPGR